ncbi:MAG: hypothetical protein JWL83_3163, partial [Actinomycetia bacterium]|nr:hypothetical protein [Actinomycetes bacterium]
MGSSPIVSTTLTCGNAPRLLADFALPTVFPTVECAGAGVGAREQPPTWDEAQILTRLSSPHILPILNADVIPSVDVRYIVT